MASTENFATETRTHMLFAVRDWLEAKSRGKEEYATINPDAVESMGSDLGLGKPDAHELFLGLIEEGYLEAEEVSVEEADVSPLREATLRGLSPEGEAEVEEIARRRGRP